MNKDIIVFSDFDGTITNKDVIISIMAKFAPPVWKNILKDILNEKITITEGVSKLFNLIPSSQKEEILDWVLSNIKIRKGFEEFLTSLQESNIPFVVLSGGLDFYIYEFLKPYMNLIEKIYCNEADFSGRYIKVKFSYDCNSVCKTDCGMCKGSVIVKYPQSTKIHIGDSITDISAAKVANIIFARGDLQRRLDVLGKKYIPFENFYDIQAEIFTNIYNPDFDLKL